MLLDYIHNINEYGDAIVRLSNFNQKEAILFRDILLQAIVTNKQPLNLNQINFIKSKNCTLCFELSATDEGVVTENNIDFICQLTMAGYMQLLQHIEPYCQKETKGYKYLYDIDSSIDLLFSPSGGLVVEH